MDHFYSQGTMAIQYLGGTRARAEQFSKLSLGMTKFVDRIVQQIHRIGCVIVRPAAFFILLDKRYKNVELVAIIGARRGTPELFDFSKRRGVVVVVLDRTDFHWHSLKERDRQSVNPVVFGMR